MSLRSPLATFIRRSYSASAPYTSRRINVIAELRDRGLIAALTSPHIEKHLERPSCVYAGIDPSASSLHVGNLLPLMGLLHFHLAGHRVIVLVGGATGSIGDPSGRSSERPILSPEELQLNVEGITAQIRGFFARAGDVTSNQGDDQWHHQRSDVRIMNNLDWFGSINLLDFLRDTGKLARVSAMLSKESVKTRLSSDSGISFTEFSYQLLQARDFSVLHDRHGCRIQLGGSDQWGNIVAGIDLIKRRWQSSQASAHSEPGGIQPMTEEHNEEVFGVTMPLVTNANGEKFGKSEGNAVWLDPERTSVSDFYQFFVRQPDSVVESYLKLFTLSSLDFIEDVMRQHLADPKGRTAQKTLAKQVTELVHGPDAVGNSLRRAELLYHTPLDELRSDEVLRVFDGESSFARVLWTNLKDLPISKIMAQHGLTPSPSASTKAIQSGSVTINGRMEKDARAILSAETDIHDGHLVIIRLGKKQSLILYIDT